MSDKVSKPISNRLFSIFGGIALILLSLILILNMVIIARAMTLPFFYVLGLSSYLLFGYVLIQGASLIFRQKMIPLKFSIQFVGVILSVISINLLLTSFYRPGYTISTYGDFIGSLDYLNYPKFLNLFEQPIGGGFLGIVLFEVLNNVAQPVPYIIGILVFLIGLAFIFMNPILGLVGAHQGKPKEKKKKAAPKKVVEDEEEDEIIVTRDTTAHVIRGASMVDENPIKEDPLPPTPQPAPIPLTQSDMNPVGSDVSFRGNEGVFTPAHFVPGVIPGDVPSSVQPAAPADAIENPFVSEEVRPVTPAPAPAPIKVAPERSEQ